MDTDRGLTAGRATPPRGLGSLRRSVGERTQPTCDRGCRGERERAWSTWARRSRPPGPPSRLMQLKSLGSALKGTFFDKTCNQLLMKLNNR